MFPFPAYIISYSTFKVSTFIVIFFFLSFLLILCKPIRYLAFWPRLLLRSVTIVTNAPIFVLSMYIPHHHRIDLAVAAAAFSAKEKLRKKLMRTVDRRA